MEQVIAVGKWLLENYQALVSGVVALLSAAIAIALVIPGPQPEAWLQKVVDFLSKFSKK